MVICPILIFFLTYRGFDIVSYGDKWPLEGPDGLFSPVQEQQKMWPEVTQSEN